MTHQSGISVSHELDQAFGNARGQVDSIRYLVAQIKDESVNLVSTHPLSDFEKDFRHIQTHLQPKIPCYIIFRLESKNMNGYEWILLSYVPDGSTVRERMLYASTRDTVKRQLGLTYFSDDLHGTTKEEFTYEAYKDHIKKKTSFDTPLTNAELQTRQEKTAEIDLGHTREYVHSVKFPMSKEAVSKIQQLSSSISLVLLKVDPNKETIELAEAKSTDINGVRSSLPNNEPRFVLFRYSHTHEGQHFDSIVFVYSCTNDSPVKLKMLYSTVKAVAIGTCEELGLKIEKKFEISESSELTEELLTETIHPPTEDKKQTFSKPTRPGRGKARLVK